MDDKRRSGCSYSKGNDIAMLGHIVVAEAIESAFPEGLPEGIDAIWYADTTLGVEKRPVLQFD